MRAVAGIDIGGTNTKLIVAAPTGRVLARGAIETQPRRGIEDGFARIRAALVALAGGHEIVAVGVGCAGLIDRRGGTLTESPNLKSWQGTPLRRIAKRSLGVYTYIDNDATCAAWGEYRRGSRRRRRHFIFITLGTGVGGGVIANGELVRGVAGMGGELGHMAVERNGRRCRCGARGCLEAYLGSYGLVAMARERLRERKSRHLTRWVERDGRELTPHLIMEAARRGDAVARRVVSEAGEVLGTAIASLVNLFNPEAVVVGGGVAASFDLLAPQVRETVDRRAFDKPAAAVRIEPSRLGNDATAIGAALLAREHFNRP